jgi:TP901-1 family phage major tail protein
MTAQKGKDLLLKIASNGAGSFVTVAGLRATTLAFNAATVDVTDTESVGRWLELLDGAGVKIARIIGSGIFSRVRRPRRAPRRAIRCWRRETIPRADDARGMEGAAGNEELGA